MANKDEFLLLGIKTEPNNDNLKGEYNYNDDRDIRVEEIHIKDEIPTMVSPLTVAINDKVPHKIKHIRTNTLTKYTIIQNEKLLECNLCNFKTSRRRLLTIHMKIHTGDKPFIRYIRNYKCSQRNSLVRGMNNHTKQEEIHIKNEIPTMVPPLTVLKVEDNYNDDRDIKVDIDCVKPEHELEHLPNIKQEEIHIKNEIPTMVPPLTVLKVEDNYNDDRDIKVDIDCIKPEHELEHLPNIKQKEIHIKDEIPTTVSPLTDVHAINDKLPHKIMHIRTNTLTKYTIIQKEKPVECSLCMKIHTGDKPFLSYICNYKCAQRNSLVRHTSSHTREKPFACKLCEFKTAQKRYLKVHITRIHMRAKS